MEAKIFRRRCSETRGLGGPSSRPFISLPFPQQLLYIIIHHSSMGRGVRKRERKGEEGKERGRGRGKGEEGKGQRKSREKIIGEWAKWEEKKANNCTHPSSSSPLFPCAHSPAHSLPSFSRTLPHTSAQSLTPYSCLRIWHLHANTTCSLFISPKASPPFFAQLDTPLPMIYEWKSWMNGNWEWKQSSAGSALPAMGQKKLIKAASRASHHHKSKSKLWTGMSLK
jgi:hypothetical protein